MNRNVSIVVAILVLVVIAAYLIWLRSRVQPVVVPQLPQVTVAPTPLPTSTASPSASPSGKEATRAAAPKNASNAATKR